MEQTWIHFIQGYIVPNWLKLVQVFWGRIFFLISSMYFCYFVIISPWKRAGPFIWTNLNSLHPRMFMYCVKFGWILPRGSGEEDENVKNLRQRRRRTTVKFWSENLTWAFRRTLFHNKCAHICLRFIKINTNSVSLSYSDFFLNWERETERERERERLSSLVLILYSSVTFYRGVGLYVWNTTYQI